MSVAIDSILELLTTDYVNENILLPHDRMRELFKLQTIRVRDHAEYKFILTAYVQHHMQGVGEGTLSAPAAFGQAKNILDRTYNQDQFQEGFAASLQLALDGTDGGMRGILNEIANTLKQRALGNWIDHVFYERISVLSKSDNLELSRAFFARYGPILKRFGVPIDEYTFAWNTRAALLYHRQMIEQVVGIAKKW